MQLKQISRILVQFSPYTGQARSAREFLARVTSAPAQASNPECQVQARVRVKGDPYVEIEYGNKQVARIDTGKLTVAQILEQVQSRAEEMDTMQKLKEAGFGTSQLESGWQQALGKETPSIGAVQFVSRQA
ncbi:39S ribosomal mitochondrial [Micractinium conductrix]|uniref:Large ribosomal subunit protein mL53 n=1 Tax=Micractinium conductrix TaxID=554055 RepID=A0A2P6V588_9CHLO|nr:39S ribosomal mitochondrial [Micractinium conductrix]|eukprot:PSC69249.1 39S ribosomal mitochondrial [Micractinium conductrix]